MDLLPLPLEPAFPPEHAPYIGNDEDRWDGGTFLSYPVRSGKLGWIPLYIRKEFVQLMPDEPFTADTKPIPPKVTECFLQKWLFFGLIAEIQGLNEREDGSMALTRDAARRKIANLYERHVRKENGSRVLNGLPVEKAIRVGLQRANKDDSIPLAGHLSQISVCLKLTSWITDYYVQGKIDARVRLSICALGDYVAESIRVQSGFDKPDSLPDFLLVWSEGYYSSYPELVKRMLHVGWCRSDITRAQSLYQHLGTLHLLSHLNRDRPSRDHSSCTDTKCNSAQIVSRKYQPAHVTKHCTCANVEVDLSQVRPILERPGEYPVLRFVSSEDPGKSGIQISVEAYSPQVPYVALSHVWADGLGNPSENSLPGCQIAYLAQLVGDLWMRSSRNQYSKSLDELAKANGGKTTKCRLWIDTLCCPVEPTGKQLALNKIADVYRQAAHILVLDKHVSSYEAATTHPAELNARMWTSSAWIRRLWTLQEGALAKSIWIAFADKTMKATDLCLYLNFLTKGDIRFHGVRRDMAHEVEELSSFFKQDSDFGDSGATLPYKRLRSLQRAVHFRSVSVLSDEAVCLSTMLQLDTRYILEVYDSEERMIRLWELLSRTGQGIPATILFPIDRTCTRRGWRWAPCSLIEPQTTGYDIDRDTTHVFDRFSAVGDKTGLPRGVPSSLGLCVRLEGYLIKDRATQSSSVARTLFEQLRDPGERHKYCSATDSNGLYTVVDFRRQIFSFKCSLSELKEYDLENQSPLHSAITDRKCAIVRLPNIYEPSMEKNPKALLVEIQDEIQDDEHSSGEINPAFRVHSIREVCIYDTDVMCSAVCRRIDELADQVIQRFEEKWLTHGDLLNVEDVDSARADMKALMIEVMTQALDSDPDFKKMATSYFFTDVHATWELIPKYYFRQAELTPLPDDQTWYFD